VLDFHQLSALDSDPRFFLLFSSFLPLRRVQVARERVQADEFRARFAAAEVDLQAKRAELAVREAGDNGSTVSLEPPVCVLSPCTQASMLSGNCHVVRP